MAGRVYGYAIVVPTSGTWQVYTVLAVRLWVWEYRDDVSCDLGWSWVFNVVAVLGGGEVRLDALQSDLRARLRYDCRYGMPVCTVHR